MKSNSERVCRLLQDHQRRLSRRYQHPHPRSPRTPWRCRHLRRGMLHQLRRVACPKMLLRKGKVAATMMAPALYMSASRRRPHQRQQGVLKQVVRRRVARSYL